LTKLSENEIKDFLQTNLQNWDYKNQAISRIYKTGNWMVTLVIPNTIGYLAERSWHHPELILNYNNIKVILSTHDAENSVTEKDLVLAKKIEDTVIWRLNTTVFEKNPNLKEII